MYNKYNSYDWYIFDQTNVIIITYKVRFEHFNNIGFKI